MEIAIKCLAIDYKQLTNSAIEEEKLQGETEEKLQNSVNFHNIPKKNFY